MEKLINTGKKYDLNCAHISLLVDFIFNSYHNYVNKRIVKLVYNFFRLSERATNMLRT